MFQKLEEVHKGERALWIFVLRRAVHDYAQYRGSLKSEHRLVWKTAALYLFGTDPVDGYAGPLSDEDFGDDEGCEAPTFEEACAAAGWDPDTIRSLAKRLTPADVKKFELDQLTDILDPSSEYDFTSPRWLGSIYSGLVTPLHYCIEI